MAVVISIFSITIGFDISINTKTVPPAFYGTKTILNLIYVRFYRQRPCTRVDTLTKTLVY
jgi:hypothetical protein